MKLSLIELKATDNLLLPGLLYEPEKSTKRILISLHGNGSRGGLYSVKRHNLLAKKLTEAGIAYLPFTNRGGHLIQKFNKLVNENTGEVERVEYGTSLEVIKDCVLDIEGALDFAQGLGYEEISFLGYSSGANKQCVHSFYQPDSRVHKHIMLGGGDDSGHYFAAWGKEKFQATLKDCRKRVELGNGSDLVPKLEGFYTSVISYQSLYDQMNPDGDYNCFPFYWELNKVQVMTKKPWQEFTSITQPTLVFYGGIDEFCYGRVEDCVDLLKAQTQNKPNFSYHIFPGGEHNLEGLEKELAEKIIAFLLP